jgi:hypothetical protein
MTQTAKLSDQQRRALQPLARSPDGCIEALMLAHGFALEVLDKLASEGLAKAKAHDTGGQSTDEGRPAADHACGAEGDRRLIDLSAFRRRRSATGRKSDGSGVIAVASLEPREKPTMYVTAPTSTGDSGTSTGTSPVTDRHPAT